MNNESAAARQLTQATERLEALLVSALGARHEAITDWAAVKFALRDAARYRWLKAENSGPIGIVRYGLEDHEDIPTGQIDAAIDTEIGRAQETAHG